MAFARFRFPHFVYFSRLKNACTLVPTVFRWHGKMAFKCHLHFSFSDDIEKQIWISLFVFRFRITLKNRFESRFSFLHCLLLKNRLEFCLSFLHEFEKWIHTPVIWNLPHPPPPHLPKLTRRVLFFPVHVAQLFNTLWCSYLLYPGNDDKEDTL